MGLMFSALLDRFFGQKSVRILMLGLDAAGKTTILYNFQFGEVVETVPSMGFNLETMEYKNLTFVVYDIGGQTKIRPLWKHYYRNTDGLIFVIDSSDRQRIEEARYELHTMLEEEELSKCPVLILANKKDLPDSMSIVEVTNKLELQKLHNRKWHVQPTSATQGKGLYEGLDWLACEIANWPKTMLFQVFQKLC